MNAYIDCGEYPTSQANLICAGQSGDVSFKAEETHDLSITTERNGMRMHATRHVDSDDYKEFELVRVWFFFWFV